MARYAEGTAVSAEQSQNEVRGLLARYGADRFMFAEDRDAAHIQFEYHDHAYRFTVERPKSEEVLAYWDKEHPNAFAGQRRNLDLTKLIASEWRRRWRARLLWLKANLEFAESEDDLPTSMAGFLVLANGATIAQALAQGSFPLLAAGS